MAATDPRSEYRRRTATWEAAIAQGDTRPPLVSNLRLGCVAAAVALAWLGFGRSVVAPAWTLAPALGFLALLVVHARLLNARDRALRARDYYARGFSRLDGSWMGSGPQGERFLAGHPNAGDLDLFGSGSLFQLLNTARTEAGEEALAGWLGGAASRSSSSAFSGADDIPARQAAVAELRDRLDFRESIAVLAAETPVSRTSALTAWAATPPAGLGVKHAWLFALSACITAILVGLLIASRLPPEPVVGWVIAQAAVVTIWRRPVRQVLRGVDLAERDLSVLTELLHRIEQETFEAPYLRTLHARVVNGGVPLSRRLARLRLFIAARDSLRNEFVRPFALLLLVRSQSAVAIDRWHAAHREQLRDWLIVVGELEALASLATYAFEHPADPFPRIVRDRAVFAAVGLAHPLIHESVGVANDVSIGGEAPHVLIVSGSNMSGKSTLLRTVGANAVLAMAGAPVRARSLECSPVTIGATMHIQDSLQSGQSRFYAEILRIRDIVDATRGPLPVLFLLDEILHGTNSHDRRIGAEAIVRALVEAGAIGLVTTHDLALTGLTETLGSGAANVHFEDRLADGKMIFDYRMREGVVEHSNALELMRAVGLRV